MSTEYDRLAAVRTCYRPGRTPKRIIDCTLIWKTPVRRTAAEFRAWSYHEEDSVSPLSKTYDRCDFRERHSEFITRQQELVNSDPSTSIHTLALQQYGKRFVVNIWKISQTRTRSVSSRVCCELENMQSSPFCKLYVDQSIIFGIPFSPPQKSQMLFFDRYMTCFMIFEGVFSFSDVILPHLSQM